MTGKRSNKARSIPGKASDAAEPPSKQVEEALRQRAVEAQEARHAALNVMEDAMIAREEAERVSAALRCREEQLTADAQALARLNELSSMLWRARGLQGGLDEMLAATIEMLGADMGNVQLFDPTRGVLTIAVQHGFNKEFLEFFHEVSTKDNSACGRTLRAGQRTIIEDVETDPPYEPLRPVARQAGYRGVQSTPLIGSTGAPLGMISTHWRSPHRPSEQDLRRLNLYARQAGDFIERIRMDEALRQLGDTHGRQLRLFNGIASTTPDFIYVFDLQGRFLYANRRLLEVWGRKLEDVIGKTCLELGYEQWHHDMHMREIAQVIATRLPIKGEVPFKAPLTGISGIYEYIFTPVLGIDGQVEVIAGTTRDITERKQAEEAVRASEARFRAAVSTVSSLIWTNNARGEMEGEQPGWGNFTGQTYEEYQGYGWAGAVHPEDAQPTIDAWNSAVAEKRMFEFEHRVRRKDGEWRLCSIRAVPLLGEGGEIREWVGVHTDITERTQAAEQLRLHRQLLETIVNYLPAAVALIRGNDLTFQMVNPGYQAIAPGKQMVGRTISEVWPEAMPLFGQRCRRVLETGEPFDAVDERYDIQRDSNGPSETAYFSWSAHRVNLPDEGQTGLLLTIWETTARKKVELALSEKSERYKALFDSIDQGFCIIEVLFEENRPKDYLFLEVNPAFAKHSGLNEAQGKWVRELVPDLDEQWFKIYGKVALTGEPTRLEEYVEAMGRWFDVFAFRIGEPEEHQVALLFTDITERKKAEEFMQSEAKRLEVLVQQRTAELREVIGELESFSYSIAHDLRGPLRAMQGYANFLRVDYAGQMDATGQGYVARIGAAAERMSRLVTDVLTYSQTTRESLPLVAVALQPLVQDIIEQYPTLKEAQIRIADELPSVLGNQGALTQVISNLLTNAVKFMPAGRAPVIEVSATSDDHWVTLSVRDNGTGIEPNNQERIFRMFERVHGNDKFEGTGIGLAIVRRAAERMGGTAGVESAGGQGSHFWVKLRKAGAPS